VSKTDKTAPYWVKQHYDLSYLEAVHRHEFHECNLPPRPTVKETRELRWGSWHDDCFWWPSFSYYRSQDARCPCYMCSYDAFDVPRRLRERREGKRYCKDGWRDEY
jgi:hypothetical protein